MIGPLRTHVRNHPASQKCDQPVRAEDIAQALDVTRRTIYRDIASLQAMRIPIDGAAVLAISCARVSICRR